MEAFTDRTNGYLVDDSCVFGVEVFAIKNTGFGECLTLKDSVVYTHQWVITWFSTLEDKCHESVEFIAGDHKWFVVGSKWISEFYFVFL